MSKKCEITGKGKASGNNVSHSNRKTKRSFFLNLHKHTFFSESIGMEFQIKTTVRMIRTVVKNKGFDNFLLNFSSKKLTDRMLKIKKIIQTVHKLKKITAESVQ